MSAIGILGVAVLIALMMLLALGAGAWWWLFRAALPMTEGMLRVSGLEHSVLVERDGRGVPHIRASSIPDLFFAQGFVHAQDRLWQMEVNRRVGAGRLAELFGARALEADRFLRRLGLRRAAELEATGLETEERAVLEAYAAGVNAAIAAMGWRLPLEMRLLRHRPEAWTATDCLAWAKVLALELSANLDGELLRSRLIASLGPERACALELAGPATREHAAAAAGIGSGVDEGIASLSRLYLEARSFMPAGGSGASNAWVVAGSRTASGKPLLANDPHLALQVPPIWHECHLIAPGLDVQGACLPGAPGVVIGHNRHVAWGFTNSFADVQDLYIERFDPASPGRYRFRGEWLTADERVERIRVKGAGVESEMVTVTRHGPVLIRTGATGLALRWTAHDPGHFTATLLAMARAADAGTFREALRTWHTPSQNIVFADDAGAIGSVLAGAIPMRARGSGFAPVPGWTGDHEWTGMIPFEELPQQRDPPSGIIVSANQCPPPGSCRHHLSWDFAQPHRAERIAELLMEGRAHTLESMAAIQLDQRCAPGLVLRDALRQLAPSDPLERTAHAALLAWDGVAAADSVGAAVYEAVLLETALAALVPALGNELAGILLGRSAINPLAQGSLVLGRYTGLITRAAATRAPEFLAAVGAASWETLLADGLRRGVDVLRQRLGPDPRRWAWGRMHRLELRHPLGGHWLLSALLGGRALPVGGDVDTVMQTAILPHRPFGAKGSAPSWRHVADLADLAGSGSILPGGQWGHPRSRHQFDQLDDWIAGRLRGHGWDELGSGGARESLRLAPR